jgi:hypothetical protein
MNLRFPTDGRWAMQPRIFELGDTTLLDTDPNPWTVKAVTANFAALTRPVTDADRQAHREQYEEANWDSEFDDYEELEGDVFYTVLDWDNGLRGPCNLIGWGYGDGSYSEAECTAMLLAFEDGELEISHRNWERIRFADEAAVR